MNTATDRLDSDFPPVSPAGPSEDAQARLEAENVALKDAIREERFGWILLSIILFDMAMFANIQTTGVPIAILLLQALLLIVLARRLGVQEIVRIADRLIEGWSRRGSAMPADEPAKASAADASREPPAAP